MTRKQQNWLMKRIWGASVLILCILLLVASVNAQGRIESEVYDLGDGYQAKLVEVDSIRAVFIKFPDSALVDADAYARGRVEVIYKLFKDEEFIGGKLKFVPATLGNGEPIAFFDLVDGTRIYIRQLRENGKDTPVVGIALYSQHLQRQE